MGRPTVLTPTPNPVFTSEHIEDVTDERGPALVPQHDKIDQFEWNDEFEALELGDKLTVESSRRKYTNITVIETIDARVEHGGTAIRCEIPESDYYLTLYAFAGAGCRVVHQTERSGSTEQIVTLSNCE